MLKILWCYNYFKILYFCYCLARVNNFCYPLYSNWNTRSCPEKGDLRMTEIDYIKNQIIEAVEAATDVDLLDLILKLLIAQGGQ